NDNSDLDSVCLPFRNQNRNHKITLKPTELLPTDDFSLSEWFYKFMFQDVLSLEDFMPRQSRVSCRKFHLLPRFTANSMGSNNFNEYVSTSKMKEFFE